MQGQQYITQTNSADKKQLTHLCMGIMRSCYYDEIIDPDTREWLDLTKKYNFFDKDNYVYEQKCRKFLNLFIDNYKDVKDYPCFKPFKDYLPNSTARHMYYQDPKQTEIFDLESLIDATTFTNENGIYKFRSPDRLNAISQETVSAAITSQINTINSNLERNPIGR